MRFLLLLICLITTSICLGEEAFKQKDTVRIGIVVDNDSPGIVRARHAFIQEVKELLGDEFHLVFSDPSKYLGKWDKEKIKDAVDDALEDPEVDLIVGIGVISSNELSHREVLAKPVFAPFIMNMELQNLPFSNGTSGVHNLNYLTFPTNLVRDFQVFQEIAPFQKFMILVNAYVLETIPELSEIIEQYADFAGVYGKILPVWTSADDALRRIPKDIEAVYVLSLTQLSDEENAKLAEGLIKRKIPSFTLFSQKYLENGFLASMSPDTDLPRLLRRVALNIQRTLLGEDPKDLDVQVSESDQLVINMKTAKELEIFPHWALLGEAVLLNVDYEPPSMKLTIIDAVKHGLNCNLDYAVARKILDIGREDVRQSKSALYPQVHVSGMYSKIDRDRAAGSFGVLPQQALWGRAVASQMIYSNQMIGDVRAQKFLQSARTHGVEIDRLDTILAISQAYLNLLRSQTIERIHRSNLERTRSHLKLARQRVDIGSARSSEVYRWESQYANDLTAVTETNYQTKAAETTLKRLLNLPQEKRITVEELSLDESFWAPKKTWLESNIVNDEKLELFIGFSVLDGLHLSEEIKELQNKICAQAEVLGIAKRAMWAPDVFLDAMVSQRAKEWGAGSEGPSIFNRTDWALTFNVSFPLYTGGYKSSKKRQSCEELKRLQLQMQSLVEIKREQIRNAAYSAASRFTAIGLSQTSVDTAQQNLALVQDAYSKGIMPIVDLLDAQNQYLLADLITANAVYDFLIDLLYFQRSVGRFDFLSSEEKIQQWIDQIDHYFETHQKEVS